LKSLRIRPTSDKVREAIFSILGQDLSFLRVLDLFAGSGSLGLEALSRGASHAVFIDHAPPAIRLIKKNLALCGYGTVGFTLEKDLRKGIPKSHPLLEKPFDLVFLDPPYGKGLIVPLLDQISDRTLCAHETRIIVESSRVEDLPATVGNLRRFDTRHYGDTQINLYEIEEK
jgi:16S rRNA (guanine966-N2)-methyltransferase